MGYFMTLGVVLVKVVVQVYETTASVRCRG